ncbi:MAG TPA: SPOR domain-containing protein [Steroidobacteraceae bacterium]|nr:SPOR domain-containing protein [Steroidobacteraceae bacterium]
MRFTYRAAGPITAAVVLTLLAGCSRTQQDWRAAQQAGTPQAYGLFVKRHPDSELAGVARRRIAQLTEEAAWQQAMRADTAAAYQGYLTRYPNGSWSQDARIRMESKSLAPAPPAARTDVPDRATPAPADAPSHHVVSGAGDNSGPAVQLGAFSTTANAHAAWQQLSLQFPSQLRGLIPRTVPITLSGRRLYRLQADVGSQSAARGLCRQLQQHSRGCLPLP